MKKCGIILEFAPDEIKNDYQIVFEAVQQNGKAFKYASDELKRNDKIKEVAIMDDKITDKQIIINMFLD